MTIPLNVHAEAIAALRETAEKMRQKEARDELLRVATAFMAPAITEFVREGINPASEEGADKLASMAATAFMTAERMIYMIDCHYARHDGEDKQEH